MTESLSKCCGAEVEYTLFDSGPVAYCLNPKCGKECEVIRVETCQCGHRQDAHYFGDRIDFGTHCSLCSCKTFTIKQPEVVKSPSPTPRLLSAEEIKQIRFQACCSYPYLPSSEVGVSQLIEKVAQAQDTKSTALTKAEYQKEIAELKTENIRLINEVVGLVTEKRELQASHKAQIEKVKLESFTLGKQFVKADHQAKIKELKEGIQDIIKKARKEQHIYGRHLIIEAIEKYLQGK